jgi:hypothetical protein
MKMNTEGYNSTITSEETYGDNISEKQIENAQEIKENIKRAISTSDDTAKNEVPLPTVDQVLDQGGTWNSAGQLVGSDGTIYENSPNRGDYLYSKGIEPKVNKETNTWYISTADGDCQVYSLGYVGDYYAKKGYPVELGNDGGHYVTASDGSVWNTSAPLTEIRMPTQEENVKETVSKIAPYIPLVSTVNNLKIAATETDLGGYIKTPGEVKEAKENVAMDVGSVVVGAAIGKAIEDTAAVAKGASKAGEKGIEITNPVLENSRTGSALKTDAQHAFNDIIDNYAGQAQKFPLKGGDGITRDLYQIEGSLNGKQVVFEWIVDPDKGVTHRLFIEGVEVTGKPNARR